MLKRKPNVRFARLTFKTSFTTLNDFEVPLDKTVTYRAKARAEI